MSKSIIEIEMENIIKHIENHAEAGGKQEENFFIQGFRLDSTKVPGKKVKVSLNWRNISLIPEERSKAAKDLSQILRRLKQENSDELRKFITKMTLSPKTEDLKKEEDEKHEENPLKFPEVVSNRDKSDTSIQTTTIKELYLDSEKNYVLVRKNPDDKKYILWVPATISNPIQEEQNIIELKKQIKILYSSHSAAKIGE